MPDLTSLAEEQFIYVTSTGRRTGNPHEIEIWFALDGATAYFLAGDGDRSDTVQNIRAEPALQVRLGGRNFAGTGRVLGSGKEDAKARRLVVSKYQPTYSEDLTEWGKTALPVAIDIGEEIT